MTFHSKAGASCRNVQCLCSMSEIGCTTSWLLHSASVQGYFTDTEALWSNPKWYKWMDHMHPLRCGKWAMGCRANIWIKLTMLLWHCTTCWMNWCRMYHYIPCKLSTSIFAPKNMPCTYHISTGEECQCMRQPVAHSLTATWLSCGRIGII